EAPSGFTTALTDLAKAVHLEQRYNPQGRVKLRTFLDGQEVTRGIRTPRVSNYVSRVSAVPGVRKEMVRLQRALLEGGGAVIEGRDMGTVVAPNADVKIFLTASVSERARRRQGDLAADGYEVTMETLRSEIARRDHLDSTRKESPLAMARDAVAIDTSELTAFEVAERILELCREKGRGRKNASRRP
ncbi:MAG: (d)CMP kinase, partial [Actinobacteria bacterium]|nr:(d)CMP kinase [Actinomycetota bacterium]